MKINNDNEEKNNSDRNLRSQFDCNYNYNCLLLCSIIRPSKRRYLCLLRIYRSNLSPI